MILKNENISFKFEYEESSILIKNGVAIRINIIFEDTYFCYMEHRLSLSEGVEREEYERLKKKEFTELLISYYMYSYMHGESTKEFLENYDHFSDFKRKYNDYDGHFEIKNFITRFLLDTAIEYDETLHLRHLLLLNSDKLPPYLRLKMED